MANSLLTIDMIKKEALALAHEKLSFIGTINRQFDSSFGSASGKIGDTLRIRLPSQYTRRQGSRVMDVQDGAEQSTSLVTATQDGLDMRFNSRELSLDMQDFRKLHLEPAIASLASGIESDVLQGCSKLVYNVAGTAGTPPTDLVAVGDARARMNKSLAPKDGKRYIQAESITMGGMVNGLKGLFQDSQQIKEQYREGMIGRTAMADWYENERVWTMTNGSDVTSVTLDTYTCVAGDADLTVTGFATPTAGMVFTFAGIKAVHPETKASYSYDQQFTILAGSTATNLLISPAMYATGARQNISAFPTTTATLVFHGAASIAYVQNLMYHQDAFTFATGALPVMGDPAYCGVQTFDGLSLRVWQMPDIRNDELLTRVDILYGYAAIRPQWACRISS
jgi:hypothetical protein